MLQEASGNQWCDRRVPTALGAWTALRHPEGSSTSSLLAFLQSLGLCGDPSATSAPQGHLSGAQTWSPC